MSHTWRAWIQGTLIAARLQVREVPRPQWSALRVSWMAVLLALSAAVLWHCEGNAWVFCCGTVVAGQLAGAAVALPFGRAVQGAIVGSTIGLLFFTFAALA